MNEQCQCEPIQAHFELNFIPTKVSELENDQQFVTQTQLNLAIQQIQDMLKNIEIPTPIIDYAQLINKPQINGIELLANKTSDDLNISIPTKVSDLKNDKNFITINDANISTICKCGIRGDYCSRYGIIDAPYGLLESIIHTNDIRVKAGIVLVIPGRDTKVTIGSDFIYTILSITDVTLFYAEGEILEAQDVYYQEEEPPEDGQFSYVAWWKPSLETWQFKSNDTGNVWRTASATPLADIKIVDEVITRIDYIGYRHLNSVIYSTQEEMKHNRQEIEENAENIGTVSNVKLDRDLTNLTDVGTNTIKVLARQAIQE